MQALPHSNVLQSRSNRAHANTLSVNSCCLYRSLVLTWAMFAGQSRSRNRSRKSVAPRTAASGCASPIHGLHLLRASRLVSLPSSIKSPAWGARLPRKSFVLRTYRKRSSGQDGRPESSLGDEGSLRGALLRNVTIARENKCFTLRTYKKTSCNYSGMNTYGTKDLKLPGMNTYRKTGGDEREAPGSLGESGKKRGRSRGKKVGGVFNYWGWNEPLRRLEVRLARGELTRASKAERNKLSQADPSEQSRVRQGAPSEQSRAKQADPSETS